MASREIYTFSFVNGSVLVFPDLKLGIMLSSDMLVCFIQFLLEVNIMGATVQPNYSCLTDSLSGWNTSGQAKSFHDRPWL